MRAPMVNVKNILHANGMCDGAGCDGRIYRIHRTMLPTLGGCYGDGGGDVDRDCECDAHDVAGDCCCIDDIVVVHDVAAHDEDDNDDDAGRYNARWTMQQQLRR